MNDEQKECKHTKEYDDEKFWWGVTLGALGTVIGGLTAYGIYKALKDSDPLLTMKNIVSEMKKHPSIREVVAGLILDCDPSDELSQIETIFSFVSNQIRYMKDPYKLEHFSDPLETLQVQAGDCDCKSILLATLLEACGHEAQFVLIPEHVFVRVAVKSSDVFRLHPNVWYIEENGKYWVPLESTAKGVPIGWMSKHDYNSVVSGNVRIL